MPSDFGPRCLRCATLLRNARTVCPSCGMTVGEAQAEVPPPSSHRNPPNPYARSGRKICPVCSSSVVAAEMVEYEGQMHCATCAEGLRAKAQRRQAADKN